MKNNEHKKEIRRINLTMAAILLVILVLVSTIFAVAGIRPAEASVLDAQTESQATVAPEKEAVYPFTGVVNGSAVRFREYPNTSSKIFEEMRKGSEVTVLTLNDGWYRVSRNGLYGYVKAEYVSKAD